MGEARYSYRITQPFDSAELGSTSPSLRPFETVQLNDVVAIVGAPADLAEDRVMVEVTAGDGRVVSVLSLVVRGSDDPTTLILPPQ